MAVGLLALAVGGAATAGASHLLTGRDIQNGSIELVDLSKKTRTALKGLRGPRGREVPSLVFGTSTVNDGTESALTPSGNPGIAPTPPEAVLSARDLAFTSTAAPGEGNSYTLAVWTNTERTPLECTISGTAKSCQAPDVVVPLPPGGTMHLRLTENGAPGAAGVAWTFRIGSSAPGPS